MSDILLAIAVVAGLCAALAVILLVSEAVLINYGICTITINEEDELKVDGGNTLLATLMEQEIFVPSACGGRGSCGLCKVKVLDGGGPLLPTEGPQLTDDEIENSMRLSCQVKVRQDISIQLPEEILELEQYETEVTGIEDLNYDTRARFLSGQRQLLSGQTQRCTKDTEFVTSPPYVKTGLTPESQTRNW